MNKTQRIRVAHLIYSPAIGGSETCAIEICSNLDTTLFKPIVLFMFTHKGPLPDILKERGIQYFYLNHNRFSRIFGPLFLLYKIKKIKIDILHTHHVPLFMILMKVHKFLGVKGIILTEHASYSISKSKRLQSVAYKAAEIVNYFTVVSANLKHFFTSETGIHKDKIQIIRNGVDTEKFNPDSNHNELEKLIPSGFQGRVLISVGRLTEAKDYTNLFNALKLLKDKLDYFLVIIGDGEKKKDLSEWIKNNHLEDRVVLAGTKTNIEKYFNKADLFVLSSQREGLPMVILEAMASGVPVIATSVGGIPELIDHNHNGVLVPPQNSKALADEIYRVCMDESFRESIKANAIKTIDKDYSLKTITENYIKLYKEIIAG